MQENKRTLVIGASPKMNRYIYSNSIITRT